MKRLQKLSYDKVLETYGLKAGDIKLNPSYTYYFIETDGTFINLGECIYNEIQACGNWHDGWYNYLDIHFKNPDYDNIISSFYSQNYKLPVINYNPYDININ